MATASDIANSTLTNIATSSGKGDFIYGVAGSPAAVFCDGTNGGINVGGDNRPVVRFDM